MVLWEDSVSLVYIYQHTQFPLLYTTVLIPHRLVICKYIRTILGAV